MKNDKSFDPQLWFKMADCPGKHYLLGNPHTYPGRILAWCPKDQRSFFVSASAMTSCSKAALYWIKGYLHGNEPAPPVDNDGQTAFGTKAYQRWLEATDLFRETGYWNNRKRYCKTCRKLLLPSQPDDRCTACQ